MNFLSPSRFSLVSAAILVCTLLGFSACSSEKFLPEGEYLLESVKLTSDSEEVRPSDYTPYLGQKANSLWFSLFKIPLSTYSLAGRDSSRWVNRMLWRLGEAPVVFSKSQADSTCNNLLLALQNQGYYHATVDMAVDTIRRRVKTTYELHPGEPFSIAGVGFEIQDREVARLLDSLNYFSRHSKLKTGKQFSIPLLNEERKTISQLLTNNGFYRFNKDFIEFSVDSTAFRNDVDVTLQLFKYKPNNDAAPVDHPRYRIRNVSFTGANNRPTGMRQSVLVNNTLIRQGDWYNSTLLQKTYSNFARLGAVRYTNIRFNEVEGEDNLLDCDIKISTNKPSTISFQPEGTNTAGDLGVAATLNYSNRNIFRGSETLSLEMRAAFEAITRLEGYQDQNFQEYGMESKLTFPRHLIPFVHEHLNRGRNAQTELSLRFDMQNRPEFHRRIFSLGWRYRWQVKHSQFRFDLLDMNYVYMPWISATFKNDYLDSEDNRNAILRYNYEDIFITKIGFGYLYTDKNTSLRTNIETSGNLLSGVSRLAGFKLNANGQHTLFNIAYAQYAKGDIDFTKNVNFDENNSFVIHAALGIAYPYGNSDMLPFEKRYFSGGANSVRGWNVRSLGPGRFRGTDGRIDFINQTGDMKLDLSLEYRTKLFWKFNGAAFIDAGNIWTLRNYPDQPGGKFCVDDFYKQIAVAYGLGLRFNAGYFILRLDCGMKAVNPAFETARQHFPLVHPRLSRDLAVHFAVGMPF